MINNIDNENVYEEFFIKCKYYELNSLNTIFVESPNKEDKTGFLIMHLNVRSLQKNIDKLSLYVAQLKRKPDIIAVSETKLGINRVHENNELSGYNFIHRGSLTNAGGVGIYINKNISFTEKETQFKPRLTEDLWIEVNINQKPMTIGVIYRHPVYIAHEIDEFGKTLANVLHKLNINKSKFCILGDFNIDLLQINQNNKVRKYANNLLAQSCKCAIDIPTRISGNSRTLLDHVYVNDFEMNIVSGVGVYDISDHFPVFINFTSAVNPKKTSNKYFTRDLNNFVLKPF